MTTPLERLKEVALAAWVEGGLNGQCVLTVADLTVALEAIDNMMARHESWTRETYRAVQASITRLTTPGE